LEKVLYSMNFTWPTVAPPSSSTIAAVIVIPEPISDDDFHDDDAAANDRERVWEIIFLIFTIKCFCYYFFHSTTAFSGPSCRLRIEQLSEIETGWMGWHMIGWYMVWCGAFVGRGLDGMEWDCHSETRVLFCGLLHANKLNLCLFPFPCSLRCLGMGTQRISLKFRLVCPLKWVSTVNYIIYYFILLYYYIIISIIINNINISWN